MIHFLLHWCLLHADSQLSGDVDKAAALSLSVDELGNFVEDTEETQLSLLEAARLARLDAIREHDARFVRSYDLSRTCRVTEMRILWKTHSPTRPFLLTHLQMQSKSTNRL